MPPVHIVIIGGAQSAKGLLFALCERLARGDRRLAAMSISCIEKTGEFGTGLAWSRRYALEGHMSSLAEPFRRVLYGDDQQKQFHGAVQLLREFGVQVELLTDEARAIVPNRHALQVRIAGGGSLAAEFVVLATGYEFTRPEAISGTRFHPSPWPASALQHTVFDCDVGHAKRILILGTYLNGVDAALTLALRAGAFCRRSDAMFYESSEDFKMVLASRNGFLPKVWGRAPLPRELRWFHPDALDELMAKHRGFLPLDDACRLLAHELMEAEPAAARLVTGSMGTIVRRIRSWLRRQDPAAILRRDIAAVTSDGANGDRGTYSCTLASAWQSVLLAALPVFSEYSHAFSAEDQLRFDRSLRTLYFNYTMPMGVETATCVEALMRSGYLSVAGLGESYRLDTGEYSDVIDARGPRGVAPMASSLLGNLIENGYIQPALRAFRDPPQHGCPSLTCVKGQPFLVTGGIYVNPATCEAIPRGEAGADYQGEGAAIFAMGPNLIGQFVDAQGIGQIERDSRRILDAVTRKLERQGVI